MKGEGPLTVREARFVEEYLVDLNGSAAAVRAGYSPKKVTARACILLARPRVKAAVQAAKEARAKATGITAERVLEEIARIGFADITDYLEQTKTGTKLKKFTEMPPGSTRVLEGVSESRGPQGDRVSVKLTDKMKALDKLCNHLGICREKVDISGNIDTELTIKVVKV
jgi:phage terminase small subunit